MIAPSYVVLVPIEFHLGFFFQTFSPLYMLGVLF